ncbi:MAG: hypothetical protein C4540_02300 [Candidatus Omnitrophota bacterium]|nr:MAG: hypothetical protein C4540_02300 [Candidatus Omnitrophota bacterium]
MGVIYKLTPKIKEFIVKIKQKNATFSCRKISALTSAKFKNNISKSTVNSVLKNAGLSFPVGRRRKKRRGKVEASGLGAIFLKAADYLLGGAQLFSESVRDRLQSPPTHLLSKTEALIYGPLFFDLHTQPQVEHNSGLWPLISQTFNREDILSYLIEIERVKPLFVDVYKTISSIFKEVRYVKLTLSEDTNIFLDGQLHTIWSTPNIPYDFSTTTYNINSYINKYFRESQPFVLFTAPGYDVPIKEFFDLIKVLSSSEQATMKLAFYGNKSEELEATKIESGKRCFLFGLWPWQFTEHRKVKSLGEFRSYFCERLKENIYVANIEVELLQPKENKGVTLKGCALKLNIAEKIGLVVLSNFEYSQITPEQMLDAYVSRWPNLQEGFQDYSRKVELFTYTASSQRYFSAEQVHFDKEKLQTINDLLRYYLLLLDAYVKWHFFPSGFEENDFSFFREHFYGLRAKIKKEKQRIVFSFKPPSKYPFLKELEYVCRRVNEREVLLSQNVRLWCQI